MKNDEQDREFTGVWIPKHVLLDDRLTPTEKMLYAEIASFDVCYKSNESLAKRLSKKSNSVAVMIGKLKRLKLVEQVGFDGRKRYIKARFDVTEEGLNKIKGSIGLESKADFDRNQTIDNNIENNIDNTKKHNEKDLLDLLNKSTNRNFRVLPKSAKSTLKEFKLEEIKQALENLKNDSWHKQKLGDLSSDYLLRATVIDRFLDKPNSSKSWFEEAMQDENESDLRLR